MIRAYHMKLVRSLAWSFHFTTGLPFDDLFQEAFLAYWGALYTYDPEKAKVSTYVYIVIRNSLIRYIQREKRERDIKWELNMRKQEWEEEVPGVNRDLPQDVQAIITFVQDCERDLGRDPVKIARGVIFRELINQGWTHRRAWEAIRETRQIVTQTEIGCIILQ